MKKKIILIMLCAIGICLISACNTDFDAAQQDITEYVTEYDLDTNFSVSDQQFFRNQNRSFSLLDEAMSPFRKEFNEATERYLYCEGFSGVWLDEFGHLNIGVVQHFKYLRWGKSSSSTTYGWFGIRENKG